MSAHEQLMRETLQRCLSYLADLNGCKWIQDDGPGGQDMRQRAKALQRIVYKVVHDSPRTT